MTQLYSTFNPKVFDLYVPYVGATADIYLGTHNILTTGTVGAGATTVTTLNATTSLTIASLNGMLKASSGLVSAATAGTDYQYGTLTATRIPYATGSPATLTDNSNFNYVSPLLSVPSINTTGRIQNTMAATDTQGIIIDGATNPFVWTAGNKTWNNITRTITGSGSTALATANVLSNYHLVWDYDSSVINAVSGSSMYPANFLLTMSGDITLAAAKAGSISNLLWSGVNCLSSFSGTFTDNAGGADRLCNISLYGGYFKSSLGGTFVINSGTLTWNTYGGFFSTGASAPTVSTGTMTLNYYGGYFEGVGTAAGTSTVTVYGAYVTATGGDTNCGVCSAINSTAYNELGGNTRIGVTTITGSINPTASTAVVGVGTLFTTEVSVGDILIVSGESRTVTAITDNTNLTVGTAFSDNANDTSPDVLKVPTVALDVTGAVQASTSITATTDSIAAYHQISTAPTANSTGTVVIVAKDASLLTANAGWLPIKDNTGTIRYIPYWN